MSKKPNPLLGKLASALPKQPDDIPRMDIQQERQEAAPSGPSPFRQELPRAAKISVSLYPSDIERLEEIRSVMRRYGVRKLTDSEALRLACRAVKIDESLVEIHRQMQSGDLRRKQRIIVA